jgi:ribosomal protein S18 acetylase RimI-like enzyme
MITLKPANSPESFGRLLELLYQPESPVWQQPLDLVESCRQAFGEYWQHTGRVYAICQDQKPVGLCWVERRGMWLFLRGIHIRPDCRGMGIGARALHLLEERCPAQVRGVTLEVHISNPRARALYARLGYRPIAFHPETGFTVMAHLRRDGRRVTRKHPLPAALTHSQQSSH